MTYSMKRLIFTALFVLLLAAGFAQKPYKVLFYNVENLFDTVRDPEIKDREFTPKGPKRWTAAKYERKIRNIERVLFDIAAVDKIYPVVIGVSEIENRNVLEDLIATPKLAPANYRIVHYDSPDARGVDVAFFYRPDQFELEGSAAIRYTIDRIPDFKTRDIVTMWGTIEQEPFYFMVAHWPSRRGGKESSSFLRERAAEIMRRAADSVRAANPKVKVVMMGDLNDDATDRSITEVIGARGDLRKVEPGGYFNPYIEVLKSGIGTLAYDDQWNLFDNIIVSDNLVTGPSGTLQLQRVGDSKFYGCVFRAPYLFQKEGQFKGYPLRTFVGDNFQNGYSDHLPVFILMGKQSN